MIYFPNCKINLGLSIIQKRDDGYHNLETVFFPIPFYDALEIVRSKTDFQFSQSGFTLDSDAANNLCVKAYQLLKKDFPQVANVQMHLQKNIPAGAGLGGGSADAAYTLLLLNDVFQLQLSKEKLVDYALQLGSDCPFFMYNTPCMATGRGEIITPIELSLSGYEIMIINPGIHISTAEAFCNIQPRIKDKSIADIIQQPITTWKEELINDFEASVFPIHPALEKIKEQLYQGGALYASLTGTGSTLFGIFEKNKKAEIEFPHSYFVKSFLIG